MPKVTTTRLTVADIEAGYDNDGWEGYGYLGERERAYRAAKTRGAADMADAAVLLHANANGWSAERLFEWLNSKAGRWFMETAVHFGMERALREAEWDVR